MTYRIGSAQGFYGDDVTRALPMITGGEVDVVSFEALSELTLAILQKDKLANPKRGYTFDIIRARVLFSRIARAGQSPEWFCVSCGGLFFEDETASCMATEEGDDRKHCICPECSERSITQSMEWEDTIDWAEVYTHYSEQPKNRLNFVGTL